MEANEIAIADVLKHNEIGLVSFQPTPLDKVDSDTIRVRDMRCRVRHVNVNNCTEATSTEMKIYWRNFDETVNESNIGDSG